MAEYPEYPSVEAVIDVTRYQDAVVALNGVRNTFFNGHSILVPEREAQAIAMLRDRYDAALTYGQCAEFEFATKASAQGVSIHLIRLGQAVAGSTGQSADEMVSDAIRRPDDMHRDWGALYTSFMNPAV
ncbi:hypothetical protein [Pseudomonas sp. LS-2]|uniref:hypothetical protein n=1 Tax=Pseudomonas sp. LS-2 TaxID=2315859 RepID=UPI00211533D4|nr:hypothetical protein [Pseudomonas sp. LS-2]